MKSSTGEFWALTAHLIQNQMLGILQLTRPSPLSNSSRCDSERQKDNLRYVKVGESERKKTALREYEHRIAKSHSDPQCVQLHGKEVAGLFITLNTACLLLESLKNSDKRTLRNVGWPLSSPIPLPNWSETAANNQTAEAGFHHQSGTWEGLNK